MVHVMFCEGRGWEFAGNDVFEMALRGNYAIIRPAGELHVKFHDGDEFIWSTVSFLTHLPCPLLPVSSVSTGWKLGNKAMS